MADHRAERPDDVRVVREVDRAHLDHRVVVDEVVEPPRAHQECGHDLAAVALLARPGDHAGLDEIDDRVREHLGMDPEIAVVAQGQRGRRGDRSDPELQRRASGISSATYAPIRRSTSPDFPTVMLIGRHIDLDGKVDLIDMDEALAERPRHRSN